MALLGTSRNKQSAPALHPPLVTNVFQGAPKKRVGKNPVRRLRNTNLMLRDKTYNSWTNEASSGADCVADAHDDTGVSRSNVQHVHSVCWEC